MKKILVLLCLMSGLQNKTVGNDNKLVVADSHQANMLLIFGDGIDPSTDSYDVLGSIFINALMDQESIIIVEGALIKTLQKVKDVFLKKINTNPEYKRVYGVLLENRKLMNEDQQRALKEAEKKIPTESEIGKEIAAYLDLWALMAYDVFILSDESNIFILIPKSYQKKQQQIALNAPSDLPFTQSELSLGLKLNNFEEVDQSMFLHSAWLKINTNPVDYAQVPKIFEKIFITHNDVKNNGYLLPHWNIVATGHGDTFDVADLSIVIGRGAEEFKQQFFKLVSQYRKSPSLLNSLWGFFISHKGPISSTSPVLAGIIPPNIVQKLKEYADSYNSYNAMLKRQVTYKEYNNFISEVRKTFPEILVEESSNHIVGLPVKDVRALIHFFDKNIYTRFLFLMSCFLSDKNVDLPFQTKNIPDTFNFVILTSVALNAPTFTKWSRSFSVFQDPINDTVRMGLRGPMNFARFFQQLNKDNFTTYKELIGNLVGTTYFASQPSIRGRGTTWFDLPTFDAQTLKISRINVLAAKAEKRNIVIPLSVKQVYITTDLIDVPVEMSGKNAPLFIPFEYGGQTLYQLYTKIIAPNIAFGVLMSKFLLSDIEHEVASSILIDEAIIKGDPVTPTYRAQNIMILLNQYDPLNPDVKLSKGVYFKWLASNNKWGVIFSEDGTLAKSSILEKKQTEQYLALYAQERKKLVGARERIEFEEPKLRIEQQVVILNFTHQLRNQYKALQDSKALQIFEKESWPAFLKLSAATKKMVKKITDNAQKNIDDKKVVTNALDYMGKIFGVDTSQLIKEINKAEMLK